MGGEDDPPSFHHTLPWKKLKAEHTHTHTGCSHTFIPQEFTGQQVVTRWKVTTKKKKKKKDFFFKLTFSFLKKKNWIKFGINFNYFLLYKTGKI